MKLKNKNMTVPIIQGGMGVGVSGKKLAAAVADGNKIYCNQ